jgi:acetoin utilization deacetylase AcuC-like enzyme
MPMKAYYSDTFIFTYPAQHRIPLAKYRLLRERIIRDGIIAENNLIIPTAATDTQILRSHSAEYFERVINGTLFAAGDDPYRYTLVTGTG